MTRSFQAVFEGGVLKPLEPLSLAEHELVSLVIERPNGSTAEGSVEAEEDWRDLDILEIAEREGDTSLSLEHLHEQLRSISGSLSDVVIQERGEY